MPKFRGCGTLVCLCCALSAGLIAATLQPVGLAAGESKFVVGSAALDGQATLFEGDKVHSLFLSTRLHLKDGTKYILGIDSEAAVYGDHVLLQFGSVDIANSGRMPRVRVASFDVAAEKPGSVATVYAAGKDRAAVMVRAGEIKVSRGAKTATVAAGQLVSLKVGPNGTIRLDGEGATADVNRIQSEQVAVLLEGGKALSCLSPAANSAARSFASLSSQLAANQAARTTLLARLEGGVATSTDRRGLAALNDNLRDLNRATAAFSQELDDAIFQHHPGPPQPNPSQHTVHGHRIIPHHGEHGHIITGDDIGGHHEVPPHHSTLSPERGGQVFP